MEKGMNKYFLIFTAILVFFIGQQWATDEYNYRNLGLVAQLTCYKVKSEQIMQYWLLWQNNQTQQVSKRGDIKELLKCYDEVRMKQEIFINQFSAYLHQKNNLIFYRKFQNAMIDQLKAQNDQLKGRLGRVDRYLAQLDSIEEEFIALLKYDPSWDVSIMGFNPVNVTAGAAGLGAITGLSTLIHGIIKDARENRIKKKDNIVACLNALRLKEAAEFKISSDSPPKPSGEPAKGD